MTQKGVGEGTVSRIRRKPVQNEHPVSIVEASGATLGKDGFPHPLETDLEGNLRVVMTEKFDEILDVLERIQQHLGQINNRNNLAPGERFE